MYPKKDDTLIDNDPRVKGRTLRIEYAGMTHVDAVVITTVGGAPAEGRRTVKIALDRIHTDGKPRKSGFTLQKRPEQLGLRKQP